MLILNCLAISKKNIGGAQRRKDAKAQVSDPLETPETSIITLCYYSCKTSKSHYARYLRLRGLRYLRDVFIGDPENLPLLLEKLRPDPRMYFNFFSQSQAAKMARLLRNIAVDIATHIIQRGNNRQICFASDEDHSAYAGWLKEYSKKYEVDIHAWSRR